MERTSVFDRIIQTIAAAVEVESLLLWKCYIIPVFLNFMFINLRQLISEASLLQVPDNNDVLAYWLCNTSTLLMLLQQTLKASGAANLTPQRRRSSSASLFGRMSQV